MDAFQQLKKDIEKYVNVQSALQSLSHEKDHSKVKLAVNNFEKQFGHELLYDGVNYFDAVMLT